MELLPNSERYIDEYNYIKEMCNSDLLNYIEFIYICNRETYEKVKYIVQDEIIKRNIEL